MKAFLRVEPRQYGYDEDGCMVTEDYSYVVVEADDGRRWAHERSFGPDEVAAARKLEGQVEAAVAAKGLDALDLERWASIDPCYGSEAHSRVGDNHLMDDDDREAAKQYGIYLN